LALTASTTITGIGTQIRGFAYVEHATKEYQVADEIATKTGELNNWA
jgi:hypothetical protein